MFRSAWPGADVEHVAEQHDGAAQDVDDDVSRAVAACCGEPV